MQVEKFALSLSAIWLFYRLNGGDGGSGGGGAGGGTPTPTPWVVSRPAPPPFLPALFTSSNLKANETIDDPVAPLIHRQFNPPSSGGSAQPLTSTAIFLPLQRRERLLSGCL